MAEKIGNDIKQPDNTDTFRKAGELNYCISSVVWKLSENSRYGFRCYLKGLLMRVSDEIRIEFNIRDALMVRGVISDVIDENYRRNTAHYEDQKIKENGDLECKLPANPEI